MWTPHFSYLSDFFIQINTLQDELKKKEMEQQKFESAIEEIKSVGNIKSSQLDLLGKQVEFEKSEKSKLLREFQEMQEKVRSFVFSGIIYDAQSF